MARGMFYGCYFHTLDEKNRFVLPAKLREAVNLEEEGHRFQMARGLDGSIFMFPPSAFQKFLSDVRGGGAFTAHREFKMQFLASVADTPVDSQGRITIPATLREIAKIEREIAVIGNFEWIEIWSQQRWDEYVARSEVEGTYDGNAKHLFEGRSGEGQGGS